MLGNAPGDCRFVPSYVYQLCILEKPRTEFYLNLKMRETVVL